MYQHDTSSVQAGPGDRLPGTVLDRPYITPVRFGNSGAAARTLAPSSPSPSPSPESTKLSKPRAQGPAVKSKPKRPGAGRGRALSVLKWLLVIGLVVTVTGIGAFYYAYTQTNIPDPNRDFTTETTKVYYADGKTELGQFATQNRESIPLAEMPKHCQEAAVAAEDRTFWTNNGIDPKGIIRAAFSNARGNATQGASTITQQYVKILYLTQERSLQRKVKE